MIIGQTSTAAMALPCAGCKVTIEPQRAHWRELRRPDPRIDWRRALTRGRAFCMACHREAGADHVEVQG